MAANDMVVVLTLQSPPDATLEGLAPHEKIKAVRKHNERLAQHISDWLQSEGFADRVALLDGSTAFSMLFYRTPSDLVERLRQAPGVVDVALNPEFHVELLEA